MGGAHQYDGTLRSIACSCDDENAARAAGCVQAVICESTATPYVGRLCAPSAQHTTPQCYPDRGGALIARRAVLDRASSNRSPESRCLGEPRFACGSLTAPRRCSARRPKMSLVALQDACQSKPVIQRMRHPGTKPLAG